LPLKIRNLDSSLNAMTRVKSEHVAGMDPAPCHILTLPFELLSRIILDALPVEPVNDLKTVPLMRIRSVCRRFRMVANQLPIWFDDSEEDEDLDRLPCDAWVASFVQLLLQDQHLLECLERKTEWKACSQPVFEILCQYVASFSGNAKQLRLRLENSAISAKIDRFPSQLPHFVNLHSLDLNISSGVHIGELPPSLEKLSIKRYDRHLVGCGKCSIEAETLKEFSFCDANDQMDSISDFRRLLPLKSSETLLSLSLELPDSLSDTWINLEDEFEFEMLDIFVALQSLYFRVVVTSFFHYLKHSHLRLTSLSLKRDLYQPADFEGLAAALQAPSLHNLTQFSLEMRVYSESLLDPVLTPVFAAVTTLPSLRHLQLDMPLAIVWVELFRQCVCLQSLHWYPGNLQKLLPYEPAMAFRKALEHLTPLPSINISTD
jgi:hypothetical protein